MFQKSAVPAEASLVVKEAYTTTEIPGTKDKKTRHSLTFLFEALPDDIQMDSVLYNNRVFVLSQNKNEATARINKVLYGSKERDVSATVYFTQSKKVYFKKVFRIKNLEPLYMP